MGGCAPCSQGQRLRAPVAGERRPRWPQRPPPRAGCAPDRWRAPMPTEAKVQAVAELREHLAGSRTLIVSEYRGLTVREIGEIRRSLRKQDVTYRVIKNRLLKIAAGETVAAAL